MSKFQGSSHSAGDLDSLNQQVIQAISFFEFCGSLLVVRFVFFLRGDLLLIFGPCFNVQSMFFMVSVVEMVCNVLA